MWKTVLLNQFHDILPGSSIHEVYEVTKREYEELARKATAPSAVCCTGKVLPVSSARALASVLPSSTTSERV